ncbi:MAG: NAD(P)H-hydrate dehydratase [Candidatus Lokiarchaeota archaeon]|nr:NAD(P)H-hydrate dehydratase [Candidatus Lokiarchaeota archaeon]
MERFISKKISSEELSILDNNSEWLGIPKSYLMECAGYSFATEIISQGLIKEKTKVAIFCGTGNNGGDGFVVARHLSSYGLKVLVILVGNPDKIRTKEAKVNWNIIFNHLTYSIKIAFIKDSTDAEKIKKIIKKGQNYSLFVDGLLGTGVEGKVREPISTAIDLINSIKEKESIKVVSIDIPSGLDPNTGKIYDKAVNPDLVITFHRLKKGLKSTTKYQIIEKSIGIPPEATIFVGKGDTIPNLKTRNVDTHKGEFGRVLVIGGSKNYSGAPAYTSLSCIQFGCDLVITYVPEVIGDVIRAYSPNMIVRTNPGDWLTTKALEEILWLVDWANAIVIGPGLGTENATEELLIKIFENVEKSKKSFVIDADALKLIKSHLDLIKGKNVVFTPHEGELKVIAGIDLPPYIDIEQRGAEIFKIAKNLDVTLLVKGPYDYISDGNKLKINKTGCPEMSIGGTGDVLAGLCASFLTTGSNLFRAACSAAFLNGYIGEYCKKSLGPRFTAMDMINNINNGIMDLWKITTSEK